jgi:hypothetical protein
VPFSYSQSIDIIYRQGFMKNNTNYAFEMKPFEGQQCTLLQSIT